MRIDAASGLNDDNLVSRRQPYFVRPGRCEYVVEPFRQDGGSVGRVDVSSVAIYEEFLTALNRALPLPYGGITNWDWWVDSYEEISEYWPSLVLLVIEGIEALASRDLHLAMELTHFMLNTRQGVGQYGTAFTTVFCLNDPPA
jgi:hypothetical protein